MIPTKIFFTRGIGHANEKIVSFEYALRDAQISCYNLVKVSSILPAQCQELSIEDGLPQLTPGQIVHAVLCRKTYEYDSSSRVKSVYASVGVAKPKNNQLYGYLGEYSGVNQPLDIVKRDSCKLAHKLLISSRDNGEIECATYEITAYTKSKSIDAFEFTTCVAAAVFIE